MGGQCPSSEGACQPQNSWVFFFVAPRQVTDDVRSRARESAAGFDYGMAQEAVPFTLCLVPRLLGNIRQEVDMSGFVASDQDRIANSCCDLASGPVACRLSMAGMAVYVSQAFCIAQVTACASVTHVACLLRLSHVC